MPRWNFLKLFRICSTLMTYKSYDHRCLSSGILTSRKHSRTTSLGSIPSIADLVGFPHCVLLGLRASNIWKSWSFPALMYYDTLRVLWPHETFLKTDRIAFFPHPLFLWLTSITDLLTDRQGQCCSITCKVLYKCGVLGGAPMCSLCKAESLHSRQCPCLLPAEFQ